MSTEPKATHPHTLEKPVAEGDRLKPLVIYHDHCTDGFGAAYAAWVKFGDEAEYLPMQYGKKLDPSKVLYEDRVVYIVDFSFPRDVMEHLFDRAKHVVWLDHHKTAFEAWCQVERERYENETWEGHYILLDNNKSGALLAWEHFHPEQTPPLVIRHIDDRDRWQWKMRCSREVHAALQNMQPWTFSQWREAVMPDDAYGHLVQQGGAVLRTLDRQVKSSADGAAPCAIVLDSTPTPRPVAIGLAVNTSSNISEVGNALAQASGSYGLVWYFDGGTKRANCSLRSIGDYDVSSIAKIFGGGGHKNAAGFNIDMTTLLEWLK